LFVGKIPDFNLEKFAYCLKFENVKFDLTLQLKEQGFNHITTWARTADNNYEVSSQGDARFSALNAKFAEGTTIFGHDVSGRTIESVYQHGVKQGDWETDNNRKTGSPTSKEIIKGNTEDASYEQGYLPLWEEWAGQNPELIEELRKATVGKTLTDKFASTRVSQARALADILNEKTSNTTDLVIVPAKDTSKKAKEIGGIDTLRHPDENGMHFGNPFSHTNYAGVQKVMPTVKDAVLAFEKWLRGEEYQDIEPERRQWIINQINSGVLIGKPLIYYTEDIPDNSWGVSTYNYYTAPNHAYILQKLINEKSLNLSTEDREKTENKVFFEQ
jgi:hypothetical protein